MMIMWMMIISSTTSFTHQTITYLISPCPKLKNATIRHFFTKANYKN
jgi:hypothetical protein